MGKAKSTSKASGTPTSSPYKKKPSTLTLASTTLPKSNPFKQEYVLDCAPTGIARCRGACSLYEPVKKVRKDHLRFSCAYSIKGAAAYYYKCWGCVTPAQIANVKYWLNGHDLAMLLTSLKPEDQIEVQEAFDKGYVADYDWNGDIDRNRYGQQYFFADNEAGNDPEDDYPLEDATDEA